MKTFNLTLATLLLALLLVGCGGTSSKNEDSESSSIQSAIFVDAAVEGMEYHTSSGLNGLTDSQGTFKYKKDDSVSFNIGNITVGDVKKVPDDNIVTPVHLVYGYDIPTNKLSDVATLNDPKVLQILNVLQSLDSDANNSNGIQIASSTSEAFNDNDEIELSNTEYSDSALLAYDSELKSKLDADDDNQLAILSRLNKEWFKGSSDKIRKCFFKKGNRLYNKRLLFERKKQKIWRDKSSLGGSM